MEALQKKALPNTLGGKKISPLEFEKIFLEFLQSQTIIKINKNNKPYKAKLWTLKQAKLLSGGGITKQNKKMPFYNYDLSAWDCQTGGKLRKKENSVCSVCYAMKGNYLRYKNGSVGTSHKRHLKSLENGFEWSIAMAYQVLHYKTKYFRFHASGDLQSVNHAKQIINLARMTPTTKYWIPTRELGFIKALKDQNIVIPKNCIFRVSAPMVDGKLRRDKFNHTSSVISSESKKGKSIICGAYKQGGQCLKCRACWSSKIKDISYLQH